MRSTTGFTRGLSAKVPLRLKLSVMAALIAVIPLLAAGLTLIDLNTDEIRARIQELQIALADDIASSLDEAMSAADTRVLTVGRVLVDEALEEDARLALARALIEGDAQLDMLAIYDPDGALIDSIEQAEAIKAPETLPPALLEALRAEGRASGQAHHAKGRLRVPLGRALKPAGEITGYLVTWAPLNALHARAERLTQIHLNGAEEELLLLDEAGRGIISGGRAPLADLKAHPLHAALTPGQLRQGASLALEYEHDGVRWVGAVIGVKGWPWGAIIQQPHARIYGPIATMRRWMILTLLLALLLALFLALLLARRISAPIQTLADFARDLSQRRFDKRVTVHTRDELALLGEAMSAAAADLQESDARIKEELAIRSDLGRYLPSALVEKVILREQDMKLGGQRVPITVLFADVVAFTPMTERLPPEEVVAMLNELFTLLTEIIFRHGGTVDKFIGDCVMAIWGAPTPQADHARRALSAAEEIMSWLEIGNEAWQAKYGTQLQIAVGINSGESVVGNIGSEQRMEYTAIGDVVNVAARLESIARPMQILTSERTRLLAGPGFDYTELGEQRLPGRASPVQIYEVQF
ncbi:HAMP domain-containing protein [Myxococcota bacterium]|nr:HAMP domain-containing protein [Myxococcota bacterium]MBU1430246.1 HAMP domain-containing protein [Myxococcota bacterium]